MAAAPDRFDVVIAGAGPAGLSAARVFADGRRRERRALFYDTPARPQPTLAQRAG